MITVIENNVDWGTARCNNCGSVFDWDAATDDKDNLECPHCKKTNSEMI